jgi:hypothetical protein
MSKPRKPFQPAIGTDFEIRRVNAKTCSLLARLIATATVAGVLATGGYGLVTGNYTAVIAVWAVAGPLNGAVVSHYFGPLRTDTG